MTIVDATELERMVDRYRLAHVIEMLAHVCHEKAKGVSSSEGKNSLANAWHEAGNTVFHTVTDKSIRAVSNCR